MMKTPLFINNRYCLSKKDLRSALEIAVHEKGYKYDDFITIILDGILVKWLQEGTEEEQALSTAIKDFQDPRHALNILCIELDLPTIL